MRIRESLNLAVEHRDAGRLAEAEAVCRQLIAEAPRSAAAWHLLGSLRHLAGDRAEAAQIFWRAAQLEPAQPAHGRLLGQMLMEMGEHDRAAAVFRQMVAAWPDDAGALVGLGAALYAKGDDPGAIDAYRRAAAIMPNLAVAHNNLGMALLRLNRFDEAAVCFERAVRIDPAWEGSSWNLDRALQAKVSMRAPARVEMLNTEGRAPYIGDKVVLLRCDREAREQLRRAGLCGDYQVDPADGVDRWLKARLQTPPEPADLPGTVEDWLQWLRNEAAASGTICTIWSPALPEDFEREIRRAAAADLVDLSGPDAGAILSQLSARAVTPPATDDKLFAVVSIRNGGLELLPHWLEHYSRLGADEILLGVFDDVSGAAAETIAQCRRRWNFRQFSQRWNATTEIQQYNQRQTGLRLAGARPRTWIVHTDLDELHQYPAPLPDVAAAAAAKGIDAVIGRLSDRVAADGSLPKITAAPSLWEQFPVECDLTGRILGGETTKVMLSRFSVSVRSGHHQAYHATPGFPIGTKEQYRVAHFKWHGDVVARMRWSLDRPNTNLAWKREAGALLDWLEKNGGRIDLGALGTPMR